MNVTFADGLHGWTGWQGVARSDPAVLGARIMSVAPGNFTFQSPEPLPGLTSVGILVSGSMDIQALNPAAIGHQAALIIRERAPSKGSVVYETQHEITLSGMRQTVMVNHRCAVNGNQLDMRLSIRGVVVAGAAVAVFRASYTDLVAPNPTPTPVPEPVPTPAPSTGGDKPEVRPFDPDHPVYHQIPVNCPLYQHSMEAVTAIVNTPRLRGVGFDGFGQGANSPNVWIGQPTDPVLDLVIGGITYKVHAPTNISFVVSQDGPLVIFDLHSPWGGQPVEYRLWQAVRSGTRVTCTAGSVSCIRNDGGISPGGGRCLGRGEIAGPNPTGSGCSYTVGMLRPVDFQRGRIDHAIRVAYGLPKSDKYFYPATKAEHKAYATTSTDALPMGARLFLDPGIDIGKIVSSMPATWEGNAIVAQHRTAMRILLRGIQEFGFIVLDGTTGGINIYWEGDSTAKWAPLLGPPNKNTGTWTFLWRALAPFFPWDAMRVADGSVFSTFGR